jgi:(p)ppGpp synthase/HD superfamily hydrolase
MYKAYKIKIARDLAHKAHKDQKRKGTGQSYIDHPRAVADRVKQRGGDYLMICTAWLHDVIEDSDYKISDLKRLGMPDDVITAVDLLTKKEGVSYMDYLKGIKNNPIARDVKIADMLSNLADQPSDKQILKYTKGLKYLLK